MTLDVNTPEKWEADYQGGGDGPLVIVRGDGVHVIDEHGRRYIEGMAGLWCASLGFSKLPERFTKELDEDSRALLPEDGVADRIEAGVAEKEDFTNRHSRKILSPDSPNIEISDIIGASTVQRPAPSPFLTKTVWARSALTISAKNCRYSL